MTLLHITNQLISFFCKEHVFSKSDFSVINVDNMEEFRESIILTSLQELVEVGIIKKVVDQEMWIMNMPPGSGGQEITFSLPVSNAVAETINSFYKANNIDADMVDPLNLNENHIMTLIEILHDILNDEKE